MINVACALIKNKAEKYLMVKRSDEMLHAGQWEFPGGKLHSGESAQKAIVREIHEELQVEIAPVKQLQEIVWEYPDKKICLIPIICEIRSGKLSLVEHSLHQWVSLVEMMELNVLEADREIVKTLKSKQ